MFRTPGTEGFALNQTMLRIRDPEPSLAFYRDVLGMTLLIVFFCKPCSCSVPFPAHSLT